MFYTPYFWVIFWATSIVSQVGQPFLTLNQDLWYYVL